MKYVLSSFLAAGIAAFASFTPVLGADVGLPNGATSLREQHGDWTVLCGVNNKDDKRPKPICILQQEQVRQVKDGPSQRVLAVEVQPKENGTEAVFVLPLGLKLEQGAVLQIDEGKASAANPFRTCIHIGCIINTKVDKKMIAALGKSKALAIKTLSDEGKDVAFSISLKGFQSALDRAVALQM